MFRGDPRRPWIDIESEKLLQRHFAMVIIQEYLGKHANSLDMISAVTFVDDHLEEFLEFARNYRITKDDLLIPNDSSFDYKAFIESLTKDLYVLKKKRDDHPELFGTEENSGETTVKSLLDALYEEGIVPTYSFPKNVVSTYITDTYGKTRYEVERGLDVAIGEYAPGRAIVVDKQTYQIGGFFYPGSERRQGHSLTPARAYIEDPNYLKQVLLCPECGWFGLEEEHQTSCPFCGNTNLSMGREMLRPWGFAPKNATAIPDAQLSEEYSAAQQPLYSTLPTSDNINDIPGCSHIRIASRTNQRIIMINNGPDFRGFMVCKDCGAAMPGNDNRVLEDVQRPYVSRYARGRCRHTNAINVSLGYDFVTDMLVLEFAIDRDRIDTKDGLWLNRAAQSLAEALRLAASKHLDVEFTELVTGYRVRKNPAGSFVDIYLYDSLSSGAGYAVSVADEINTILEKVEEILKGCTCSDACHNCLKHYRNQYVHGMLDRFAGLQLLEWGRRGTIAKEFSIEEQKKYIAPLQRILNMSGCRISTDSSGIFAKKGNQEKKVVIYPAMWTEPRQKDTVFVSDVYIKYAKPYAVQKMIDEV